MKQQTIYLWEAIQEMQRITKAGGTFSFAFYKYDSQSNKGGDLARIACARLRAKTPDNIIENSSHKLFFTDVDNGLARVCWQPLIVEFNGFKCIL